MSTRNNNVLKNELLKNRIEASDTIKDFMEKCNNNFSIISEMGGGHAGVQGEQGSQGVPTKPKVPIHVWREGIEYFSEAESNDGYVIDWNVNLTESKYQEGHLIMLKNGHVYILEEDEESKLKPNYIMGLQSYNQDDIINGRSAYIHIAFANSQNGDGLILSEDLKDKSEYRKYMGIYSDYNEQSLLEPELYTWVRIVGDTGEKGEKGEKGDTPIPPTSTNIEVVGYSLSADLELNSPEWKEYITDLGTLEPGTYIYMKNRYTWSDGTTTYGKTVTMSGTQGIKGETGRVLFYLGSFEDGTLKADKLNPVYGILTDNRCDYYIDVYGQAWMRTGTETKAVAQPDGSKNNSSDWTKSEKVGFLQAGAIHADMINANSFIGSQAIFNAVNAAKINADNITTGTIKSTNENSNSYFDLVNNEFVLGDANGAALEYKNNTLTIGGVPSQSDIDNILTRIGLVDDSIEAVDDKTQALEYLKKALENNTEIVNGLIATSSIQLRDWTGKYVDQNGKVYNEPADGREKEYKVNSGLSGIDNDNVLLWGGGTYSEAVNAAISENDYHKQPGNDEKIATLIKTDGTGKIGSFEIVDNHTVSVNSSNGNSNIVISAGQNEKDTNIIINQGNDMKVLISGDTIEKNSIYGVELKGRYALNEEITASNQNIVVKNIEVPPGTGNWSVNFNAEKLMIMFGVAPLSSISGVSCIFNVYLCDIEIAKGTWKKESISSTSSSTSSSQEVGFSVDLTPFTSVKFTNTDGQSTQTLEVKLRNVQVKRGSEWSTDYNQKLYLSNIRICTKTGDGTNMDEDYVDDSILLTYASSIGIIQIGRNGIQVSHKNGGFVQILNDDSELYVRMFGLPTYIPTGNNIYGNIYNWNGFLRIAGNESTSKESTTIDLTEIGCEKVVLPSKVEIQNVPEKGGIYGQNELYRYSDGDIFINAY